MSTDSGSTLNTGLSKAPPSSRISGDSATKSPSLPRSTPVCDGRARQIQRGFGDKFHDWDTAVELLRERPDVGRVFGTSLERFLQLSV